MNPWQTMLASGLGAEPELNLPKPKKAPMDPRMLASFVEQGNTAAAPPEPESVLPDPNNFIPPAKSAMPIKMTSAEQDALFQELLDIQRGQSDRLSRAADDFENQEQQFDLSPLMALADSWTGSKLASAYKAPMSRDERALTAMKLRDAAGDATGKSAQIAMQRLNAAEANEDRRLMRQVAADSKNEKNENRWQFETLNWAGKMNKDPLLLRLQEQDLAFDQVNSLLDEAASGNTVAFSATGPKMAKALGEVGVLTETDVKRYTKSAALARSAVDKWELWRQGMPSKLTMDEIKAVAQALRDKVPSKIIAKQSTYVNQLAAAAEMPLQKAAKKLDVNWDALQQYQKSGKVGKAADSGLVRPKDVPEADWKRMPEDLKQQIINRGK